MKITELNGLFVAYDSNADFRILIAANDREEATAIAINYFSESGIWEDDDDEHKDALEITDFENADLNFDCDYIVLKDQEVPHREEPSLPEPEGEWIPHYSKVEIWNTGGFTETKQTGWDCPKCKAYVVSKSIYCPTCGRRIGTLHKGA